MLCLLTWCVCTFRVEFTLVVHGPQSAWPPRTLSWLFFVSLEVPSGIRQLGFVDSQAFLGQPSSSTYTDNTTFSSVSDGCDQRSSHRPHFLIPRSLKIYSRTLLSVAQIVQTQMSFAYQEDETRITFPWLPLCTWLRAYIIQGRAGML